MTDDGPTRWNIVPAPDDHPHDVWAVGADLTPATLVAAYTSGLFPMRIDDTTLGWWSPVRRGVVPLAPFRPSRSLLRSGRRYELRYDSAFAEVVKGCADPRRPGGWIDREFADAYGELHRLGIAHSVEAWDRNGLAGGLYGVSLGGLFAAESMYFTRTDASKAAFLGLVERLRDAGDPSMRLLDVQWLSPHLERLGASAVSRGGYHRLLRSALRFDSAF